MCENVIKTIIADYGGGDIGKSSAIKEVYNQIKRSYPQCVELDYYFDGDIRSIFEINKTKIGIESQGDPYSRQPVSLDSFLQKGCDIIIVACRTKGDTIEKVRNFERYHGYRIIWAQHHINKSVNVQLNTIYTRSIVQMVDDIMNGVL